MAVSRLTIKGQRVDGGPNPGNLHPFSKIARIILPLISLWNYPTPKNQPPHISPLRSTAFCLWTVYLSKWIYFLPITLCLDEFLLYWDKEPELQQILRPNVWSQRKTGVQIPIWVLAVIESRPTCSSPNVSCTVSGQVNYTFGYQAILVQISTLLILCMLSPHPRASLVSWR